MLDEREIEDLKNLRSETDIFTARVFDWVNTLNQHHILGHLYDLKNSIEEKLKDAEAHAERVERAFPKGD